MKGKMKRFWARAIFASALIATAALVVGCVSIKRARKLIMSGDKVSAIEMLCKLISNKKDEAEAVALFIEIYPSTVEEMRPQESVQQLRKEFADKHGGSEIQAIEKCAENSSSIKNVMSHPDIANVIRKSERIITAYGGLARIKKAVLVLPRVLYDEATGEHEVVKYSDDFAGLQNDSKRGLAEFYYNIAEAFFPGTNTQERIWLIDFYKKAESTYSGIGQTAARCAELCYLNGQEYERLSSIAGKKEAISWYKNALVWQRNYKDANERVQILSYEIAMLLLGQARTKEDYKEILVYLSYAGNYRDTQALIIKVKYYLAYLYRADRTISSYEEAGKIFETLGNYKLSPYETSLYNFYKKLKTLNKGHAYGRLYLSAGAFFPFTMTRNLVPNGDDTSTLRLSRNTSVIDVFIPSMEKTIYPGSIIEGDTIAPQNFAQFAYGARNPVAWSLSSSERVLSEEKLTNPLDANYSVKEIHKAATRCSSMMDLDCTYEFHTIYSPEDLELTTGIGLGRDKVSYAISAYGWNPNKSYTLVKVTQKFYSAALRAPSLPIDFFAVNKNVVTPAMLRNVTPYYVASVDYGRKACFVICSDLTSEEIVSDFKRCRPRDKKNSGASGMRVNQDVAYKWERSGTTVNAITVSEKIYSVNSLDGIYNWIKVGSNMAVEADDLVPISFVLRNLLDNSYARLSQEQSVVVKTPQPKEVNETKVEDSSAENVPKPKEDATPQPAQEDIPERPEPEPTTTTQDIPASAYNGDTSLIFVGKKGYYKCSSISVEQGSGVKTYYYDIPAAEIEVCVASWSDSEFASVTVNGIAMQKNKTVYSFRDVSGNTISLDTVDSSGKRVHNLLVVRRR